MEHDVAALWRFLPVGYAATVLVELPVLLLLLSPRHAYHTRFLAGLWLTACTYPIVVLVLPIVVGGPYGYGTYLLVAETFAPVTEVLLLRFAFVPQVDRAAGWSRADLRDACAVVAANLASFAVGVYFLPHWWDSVPSDPYSATVPALLGPPDSDRFNRRDAGVSPSVDGPGIMSLQSGATSRTEPCPVSDPTFARSNPWIPMPRCPRTTRC